MGGFLQNNWFWLLLVVFFIWMHRSEHGVWRTWGPSAQRRP